MLSIYRFASFLLSTDRNVHQDLMIHLRHVDKLMLAVRIVQQNWYLNE